MLPMPRAKENSAKSVVGRCGSSSGELSKSIHNKTVGMEANWTHWQ